MRTIAVTGASGFIGRSLVARWRAQAKLRPIVRNAAPGTDFVAIGDIGPQTEWDAALDGIDAIVHCAGRAHILNESEANPLAVYRQVNRDGTLHLAHSAKKAGVRRIVFLSSIGVMGEQHREAPPFSASDTPAPRQDYALSKWEAEQGLAEIAEQSGLETVIVRPPLVYGPGAPANFDRLLRVVDSGLPLPLGRVRARRSFVGISNLSDMLWACVESPQANGQTFMVSDGEDLSTADLVRRIGHQMGKRPFLLPVPLWTLQLGGRLLGRTADVDRLLSPLRVSIDDTRETLGWSPRVSVDEEVSNCVAAFKSERRRTG